MVKRIRLKTSIWLLLLSTVGVSQAATIHINSCQTLDQADATYILDNDVTSEGTCFTITANGVTLDLNSKTVTYDDYPMGIPNANFELGSGGTPADWDLSQAPGVIRRSNTELAFEGQWHLYFGAAPNGTRIVSSYGNLPPNSKAVVHFIRGDYSWSYKKPDNSLDAPIWEVKVEADDGTEVFKTTTDTGWHFEFNTLPPSSPNRKYRAILTLLDNKDYWPSETGYFRYPSIDWFDIRTTKHYGISAQYKNNITITNGRVIQGAGKGFRNHNIFFNAVSAAVISNVQLETSGFEASSFLSNYGSDVTFQGNNVLNRNPYKAERMQVSAAVNVGGATSNVMIQNNKMDCGPGWGCVYVAVTDGASISDNTIKTNSVMTNHYGIIFFPNPYYLPDGTENVPKNVSVLNNHVDVVAGGGIAGKVDGGKISGNTIIMRGTEPNSEYGFLQWDAIMIKDYSKEICKNLEVSSNDITLYGDITPLYKDYSGTPYINGIMGMCTGGNFTVNDNTINAVSVNPRVLMSGLNPGGRKLGEVYEGNTVTSDSINVMLGGYGMQGVVEGNTQFISNTFIKGSNPINYNTLGQLRSGQITSENFRFIDTQLQNGASLSTAQGGGYLYRYFVDWYLNLHVTDVTGQPVPNADVTVYDNNSTVVFTGKTDANGEVTEIQLTELESVGAWAGPTITEYTPHTITVEKVGLGQKSVTQTMRASTTLTVILGGSSGTTTPSSPTNLRRVQN